MAQRRSTDGWLCKNCQGVYFAPTGSPLCPWCYREAQWEPAVTQKPALRRKLQQITGRLRAITERDGWDCWLCGQAVDPRDLGLHRASADHVLPKRMGGGNELSNLRLAHASCNAYRSGSKVVPFAPFDNRWPADHERREHHEALQ